MDPIYIQSKDLSFHALSLKAENPTHTVIFNAGSGGNPERHWPLLNFLFQKGCAVIAPYFDRIISPYPTKEELMHRIRIIEESIRFVSDPTISLVGIGHSIGATLLLSQSGGKMWMREGDQLPIPMCHQLKKLILFAPPTGFFQAPKSLVEVRIPVQVWGGSLDTITPPQQLEVLKTGLPNETECEVHIEAEASHFSFMNTLPPNITDTVKNRDLFISKFTQEVFRFLKA